MPEVPNWGKTKVKACTLH